MLLAGLVLLVALQVVVARLDHLGYQLKEGVRSAVVGMAIPMLLAVWCCLLRDILSRFGKMSQSNLRESN